jgi:hypothetical protein
MNAVCSAHWCDDIIIIIIIIILNLFTPISYSVLVFW